MPSQHPSSNPDNMSTSEKKKRTKFITIAIVGFLILVIVGMSIGFISDQDEPPAEEAKDQTTLQIQAPEPVIVDSNSGDSE